MASKVRDGAAQALAQSEQLTCTIQEACYLSGLSRDHFYAVMNAGELPFLVVGRARLIERDALVQHVHRLCQKYTPPRRGS
jgi:excisionase family DNA binding protein